MRNEGRKDRTTPKKHVMLEGHKRVGKKFLPPMSQLPGGMNKVSWTNRILPELIWMGVLNDNCGLRRGIELSSTLARLANETYGKKKVPNFAFTSSYVKLDIKQKNLLLEKLAVAGILADLRNGLKEFLNLYPESPLSFLRIPVDQTSSLVASFKATLEKHFYRHEQPAMVIQANVIYIAGACGKLFYSKNVKPPDLNALISKFESEEGKKAAAQVRAATTGFVGMMLGEKNDEWPRQFWNQGLEIEKCTFNGESTDG